MCCVFCMLRMQTRGLPENHGPHLRRSQKTKTCTNCLNVQLGFKVHGYQGPFNLVRIDTSQNQRRRAKPANILSPWHVEIIGFSCILYRVKSLIKLYGSLWAKFCLAGILILLPLYFETKLSIQQKNTQIDVDKSIDLSCGLSPSDNYDHSR